MPTCFFSSFLFLKPVKSHGYLRKDFKMKHFSKRCFGKRKAKSGFSAAYMDVAPF